MSAEEQQRVGHGDHWRAALEEDDPRLLDVIAFPTDAPLGVKLHRRPLLEAIDMVQVTARPQSPRGADDWQLAARLLTAYPEPRATALVALRPRELILWETRVEGWLVAEHVPPPAALGAQQQDAGVGAGTLTLFLTDLVENASRYDAARGVIHLELGALAYTLARAPAHGGMGRLRPAREKDARFLPDDYWFDAPVRGARPAGAGEVLELELQNGLELPVVTRRATRLAPGERASGFLWLTGRWPEGHEEQG